MKIETLPPTLTIAEQCSLGVGPYEGGRPVRAPVHMLIVGVPLLTFGNGSTSRRWTVAIPPGTVYYGPPCAEAGTFLAAKMSLDARLYTFEAVERLAHKWRKVRLDGDDPLTLLEDVLRLPRRRLDRRLETTLTAIESGSSVAEAARQVRLSESRLTHLCTDQLGAPPRSWRPWLRMRRAVADVVDSGASPTRAAHEAGFADAAHFTRTCRRNMGITPSGLASRRIQLLLGNSLVHRPCRPRLEQAHDAVPA